MRVVIVDTIEVAPEGEAKHFIYEVEPAKRLKIKKLAVDFPVNTNYQLEVEFFNKDIKIIPTEPDKKITGENTKITITEVPELVSGDKIYAKLKNLSTTETKRVTIELEGELE